MTGQFDSPAFQQQAVRYGAALVKQGLEVRMVTVPEEDHFSLVERLMEDEYSLTKDILDWLRGNN